MKSLVLSVVFLAASTTCFAADSSPMVGKWKIHSVVAGNESSVECTFTQIGSDLEGTCTTDSGSVKATGKIDGAAVSFAYNSDYNGTALNIKYSGKLDPATAKLSGSVDVDPFGVEGDFTAEQVK